MPTYPKTNRNLLTQPWLFISAFVLMLLLLHLLGRVGDDILLRSGGLSILDTRFFFAPADVYNLLDALGNEGIALYQGMHLGLDLLFPFVYTLFFISLGAFLRAKLKAKFKRFTPPAWILLLAGFFDLLENGSIMLLAWCYPLRMDWLAKIAQVLTLLKFFFFGLSIALLLFYLALALFTRLRHQPQQSAPDARHYLGQLLSVQIDRPLGSIHPQHGFTYPLNYGYLPGVKVGDGEALDAYVLGVQEPLQSFEGLCLAVVHRLNDNEDKLVLAPLGSVYSAQEILQQVDFQEQFFEIELILPGQVK